MLSYVLKLFFTGWSKKFRPWIVTYNSLFLLVEDNISCNLLDQYYFQMIKQKAYLFLENFNQLSYLNINFVSVLFFD